MSMEGFIGLQDIVDDCVWTIYVLVHQTASSISYPCLCLLQTAYVWNKPELLRRSLLHTHICVLQRREGEGGRDGGTEEWREWREEWRGREG